MKATALLEVMDSLYPADFFAVDKELVKGQNVCLPNLSPLLDEEGFASFTICWEDEGIRGEVVVHKPFEDSFFPEYTKGDAIELFLDTRDNKRAGVPSRFCHRFLFLPGDIGGVRGREITRFAADDERPLCDSSEISVSVFHKKTSYSLQFFLPESKLYGFHPNEFPRIGLAYQIHRLKGTAQSFPCSNKRFPLWQHPNLWASLTMKTIG